MKRLITTLTTFVFLIATTPFVLAIDYDVELVVPDGKKSKETDAVLRVSEDNFQVVIEKPKFKEHEKTLVVNQK